MPAKRFSDPPIIEVVCGILFDPIDGLDPVLVGRFWDALLERFPRKQLVPAIPNASAEGVLIEFATVPALRTWLVSDDDSRVMQIQSDRFYLNWRSRGSAYPSFNPSGDQVGLLREVVDAFGAFERFLTERARLALRPVGIELSMFDDFRQGRHWGTVADLAAVLPSLRPFLTDNQPIPRVLKAHVEGPITEGDRRVAIQRVVVGGVDAVRLETTARLRISKRDQVEPGLERAHAVLKSTFDELIPMSEHYRFETGWSPRS